MSGNVTTTPILRQDPYIAPSVSSTLTFTGTGPNKERQEQSHPHQIAAHPDREELLVPDLGADKVRRLLKGKNDAWEPVGEISFTPGGGPRHVAFYSTSIVR